MCGISGIIAAKNSGGFDHFNSCAIEMAEKLDHSVAWMVYGWKSNHSTAINRKIEFSGSDLGFYGGP